MGSGLHHPLPRLRTDAQARSPLLSGSPTLSLGHLTPTAVHSFGIVRFIDVQEAEELSNPELVGIRELVGPGYHLIQAICLLDLKW